MNKLAFLLVLALVATSCDDGDIIVTQIDFDEIVLERCEDFGGESEFIFFKTNSETNEGLALQFETTEPIFTEIDVVHTIPLTGDDQLSYRRFDGDPSDFFCNAIPPSTPTVIEEFTSTVGTIDVFTSGVESDDDGIPSEIEDPTGLLDTDQDGLFDFIDFDDDGDNVPTRLEGVELNEEGTAIDPLLSRDTDGDLIPDYLDEDDDGDGVLTRNEDANMDLNPSNDNSDPNFPATADYLNNQIAVETIVNSYREHEYFITELTLGISVRNTILINPVNQEELRDETVQSLGTYSSNDFSITLTPFFN